ncbi:hypothetical protein LA66_18665 [Aureimonas altamirensis]|uniref:Transglutaminase n=1 Tax=Aureimonas altamirensis TaxID=370622 RepID=A0A0B1Q3D8_9HYPH|nr:transglutaminase-like cysteine peptidase [Aureimonas altamirensis]KHJ53417.1 hypothetical protein LA66_18665 [Aureimonas altamirensis]
MGRLRALLAIAIASTLCAGAILPAQARPLFMPLGGPTSQPIGHFDLCRRLPQECRLHAHPVAGPLALSPGLLHLVAGINRQVNADIEPASDWAMHGQEEYWSLPVGRGDCEDYALLKRERLVEAGLPASNLLMTVVRKPNGEGHAVLTLTTRAGDFVLDNLDARVRSWGDTPYTYLKRQDSADPGRWVRVEGDSPVRVASGRDARVVPAALR